MQKYKVTGPCRVAGVAPGGIVTREQVESYGGAAPGTIHFDALVGPHLTEVAEPEPKQDAASKKAAK